jgi:hypothetical protein
MNRNWTRGLSVTLVAICSLVIVADVNAGHRRRRGGCGGCGGGYAGGYGGGYGGYGYGGYNYGGGYARCNYAPGYYGGGYAPTYGGTQVYGGTYGGATINAQPGVSAGGQLNAGPNGIDGTANADLGSADRSARTETRGLTPTQDLPAANANIRGDAEAGNPGAQNAENAPPSPAPTVAP